MLSIIGTTLTFAVHVLLCSCAKTVAVVIVATVVVVVIYFFFLRVFHTIVSWRFLSECWVTASLLKCPGLFLVLIMLSSNFQVFQGLYQAYGIAPSAPTTIGITLTFKFHCCLLLLLFLASFSHQCYLIVGHWSLSDCKSSRVSRTLLSIRAGLNKAVGWMVSARPLISNPSSSLTKL